MKRVAAGYFVLQAIAGTGFWILLAASTTGRSWFEMSTTQHAVTNSFFFADVLIGILGSLVAAAAIVRDSRAAVYLSAFVAGSLVYATLYLVGWVSYTGKGGGLLALMLPPSTLSTWMSYQVWRLANPRLGLADLGGPGDLGVAAVRGAVPSGRDQKLHQEPGSGLGDRTDGHAGGRTA